MVRWMGWEPTRCGWPSAGLLVATMLCAALWPARPAQAETVTLEAARDNTLYESLTGVISNALGSVLFAGRSGFLSGLATRRLVLVFDVAGSPLIPEGAQIEAVELRLNVSKQPLGAPATVFALHRLVRDWGEGTSRVDPDPLFDNGAGMGALATAGDATWLHSSFNTILWISAGGDFVATASATATVSVPGLQTWSSAQLVADVAAWRASPSSNFGWLLRAQVEITVPPIQTARRFDSREHAIPSLRPQLVVSFSAVCADTDADGVCDLEDNCPFAANPAQLDGGGVGSATPDGTGDACQCGDVTGDGIVNFVDAIMINREASPGLIAPLFLQADNCDVTGDGICNFVDAIMINREASPGLTAPLFDPAGCPNAKP